MTTISNNIQKKVKLIFWTRRLTSRRALESYVLFLSTIGLFSFVSVPHVFANMPSLTDIAQLLGFILAAFDHTNLLVQITLSVLTLAFISTLVDFASGTIFRRHAVANV